MDNYLKDILESGNVYYMNDERTIISDRMGSWSKQDLVLAWEGDGKNRLSISVSPDEAEILFEHGLLSNVQKDPEDGFYIETVHCDIRQFDGAIVCGVISPSTKLREGILEYSKRMGYILDCPTPVEMFNGTKLLTCNDNGPLKTYKITYKWSNQILKKFNIELVKNFTQKFLENEFANRKYRFTSTLFYSSPELSIEEDGFSVDNLLEREAFSRTCIDLFRVYDIQVRLLSPDINITFLLKATIQLAFVCDSCPENLYSAYEYSLKDPTLNMSLPIDTYNSALSKENRKLKLQSGKIIYSYSSDSEFECYTYQLEVPYSEAVRSLMKNTEIILKKSYMAEGLNIEFNPNNECIYVRIFKKEFANYKAKFEKDFITLDYAISMLKKTSELNYYQMIGSILELMASDTNLPYRELFTYYFDLLYENVYKRK